MPFGMGKNERTKEITSPLGRSSNSNQHVSLRAQTWQTLGCGSFSCCQHNIKWLQVLLGCQAPVRTNMTFVFHWLHLYFSLIYFNLHFSYRLLGQVLCRTVDHMPIVVYISFKVLHYVFTSNSGTVWTSGVLFVFVESLPVHCSQFRSLMSQFL